MPTQSYSFRVNRTTYTYDAEVYVNGDTTLVIASADSEHPGIFSAENDFSFVAAGEFANENRVDVGRLVWFVWEGGAYYMVTFGIDGSECAEAFGNYYEAQRIPVHPSVVSGMIQAFTS